ncbi:GYDIA family GHMP kinase [Maribacter polysaccharolyticus]|uniref:GYDIA family GHMP kinase n=1 Tax=Maribacter polysaccharolyticus TaxID=3020831 RepID=UPI00237EFF97|nr:GYDIA family GHMP kinase [Maribacter polysaccharolyticus]MDE3742887.1 GYDIA family GHMP kinase [Maribacter polysaccharolyticus]
MKKTFYSNGKLLLTGEYAVLDGAKALALPTKYGQHLTVTENPTQTLIWESLDKEKNRWFDAVFDLQSMAIIRSSDNEIATTAQHILRSAQGLNPMGLKKDKGYHLVTQLTFPKDWGLGSSSTLINNIALWLKIDPYTLLKHTFGGSGYDIACARHNTPITYKLDKGIPVVEEVSFDPAFKDRLFFVYLNKKQNSREGISKYRDQDFDANELIRVIDDLTGQMVSCTHINTFEILLTLHESVISQTLQTPTIKNRLFPDYPRAIKSLGAWGGDFILVVGDTATIAYFRQKGYHTIIPYSEMIL